MRIVAADTPVPEGARAAAAVVVVAAAGAAGAPPETPRGPTGIPRGAAAVPPTAPRAPAMRIAPAPAPLGVPAAPRMAAWAALAAPPTTRGGPPTPTRSGVGTPAPAWYAAAYVGPWPAVVAPVVAAGFEGTALGGSGSLGMCMSGGFRRNMYPKPSMYPVWSSIGSCRSEEANMPSIKGCLCGSSNCETDCPVMRPSNDRALCTLRRTRLKLLESWLDKCFTSNNSALSSLSSMGPTSSSSVCSPSPSS